MEILVITNISVLPFYRYIGYIRDILAYILTQNINEPKIDQKFKKKCKKKLLKIKLEVE